LAYDKANQYQANGDQKGDHRGAQGQSFNPSDHQPMQTPTRTLAWQLNMWES
jgi:hypothetical protein